MSKDVSYTCDICEDDWPWHMIRGVFVIQGDTHQIQLLSVDGDEYEGDVHICARCIAALRVRLNKDKPAETEVRDE